MKHVGPTAVGELTTSIIMVIMMIGRFIAGAVIISIILAIMMGDIGSVAALYFSSIICTFGIGSILWLPLWYGVGWIVIEIPAKIVSGYLGSEKDKGTTSAADALSPPPQTGKLHTLTERLNQELRNDPALARNQVALLNYVRKAREKGLSNQQITLNLTNTGWPTGPINWAFNILNQQSNP